MKHALWAAILFLAPPLLRAQPPDITDAPKSIQELAASIQGKDSKEVRAAIINRFGVALRDVGSGVRIEVWRLPEGVLKFHPFVGPTFLDQKTSQYFWLLRTRNHVAANILQSYEMFTLADPANHGTSSWLGDLEFGSDSTYRFIDSNQFPDQRTAQKQNFFMLHPVGSVEVHYAESISADTLLESVEEGKTVGNLVFTSSDHKHTATFSIASSERDRSLEFKADKPLSFEMATGWQNYWQ
jgi:hypothetical protein